MNQHPCFKAGPLLFFLKYSLIYMGASADKAEYYLLNRLSRHKAWELHTQRAKESFDAMHNSNIGT